MKITYFQDTDTLYIEFRAGSVTETRDLDENTLLDLGVPSSTKLIHHPVVILSAAKDLVFESLAGNGHAQADRSRIAGRHQAVAALLRLSVGHP